MSQAMKSGLTAALALTGVLAASAGHAALVDNSDGTVTDTGTNLMWATDANLFATVYNGLANNAAKDQFISDILALTPSYSDPLAGSVTLSDAEWDLGGGSHTTNGRMTIFGAIAFVNWLNDTSWAGYSDWRLPEAKPLNGVSFQLGTVGDSFYDGSRDPSHNFTNSPSELTHLYYDVFGMQAQYTTTGVLRNPGEYGVAQTSPPIDLSPFFNFEQFEYFTGTFSSVNDNGDPGAFIWTTNFGSGVQHLGDRNLIDLSPDPWFYLPTPNGYTLFVRDATVVPVPGAVWLFGSALVGLVGRARRKEAA